MGYQIDVAFDMRIVGSMTNPEEEYIINFVRFVREFRDARIESITTGDIKCTLIYASSKYLSMMDKGHVKTYKKSRHLLSTKQKSIISAM